MDEPESSGQISAKKHCQMYFRVEWLKKFKAGSVGSLNGLTFQEFWKVEALPDKG